MQLPVPRFTVRQHGYAFAEVDALLRQLNDALSAGRQLSPEVISQAAFGLSTNSGYDVQQVDAWLDAAYDVLASGQAQPFTRSGTPAPTAPTTPTTAPTQPPTAPMTVIKEAAGSNAWPTPTIDEPWGTPAPKPTTPTPASAIQELPATPRWATALVLLTLFGLVALIAWHYLGS